MSENSEKNVFSAVTTQMFVLPVCLFGFKDNLLLHITKKSSKSSIKRLEP